MWGKVQTVGTISDFMSKGDTLGTAASFSELVDWALHPVEHTKDVGINVAYEKIEPFLDILGIVAYPVASMLIGIAGLLYILNLREKSISWLTKTSITYVLIQLLPMLTKATLQILST
ncbi:hypothetical protein QU577_27015 [Priestia megaterium]|uniref:hypothetical protein n=1 Tax=Priestia megaterium TaxID=1404 RepID=UPI0025B0A131|nr:hypothetical protein [Priestia megaterium]MDN3365418.1 hypothetical protein [Priestia megaterium]